MSKELPTQTQQSEEVDLGQLFKLIGNAFDRFFRFIGSIFKAILSVVIYSLKIVIKYFKVISISMLVAFVLGVFIEISQKETYISQMLVKPYFESKYQLITNIKYYNALIKEKDYDQLKEVFDIELESAEKLVEFDVAIGPESENDQIQQYDNFLRSIDSVRAQEISFEDFISNRNIYSANVFEINVISRKKDIFRALESGLNKTFTNTYSSKKMQKRDSLIALEKASLLSSLKEVDSLKKVYIKVLQDDANSKNQGTLTLKDGMSLVQERVKTKEFELLEKEISLKAKLNSLDSEKVEEDVFFDTMSSFQDVGTKYKDPMKRYAIIFPILVFIILALGFLSVKAITFTKKYNG